MDQGMNNAGCPIRESGVSPFHGSSLFLTRARGQREAPVRAPIRKTLTWYSVEACFPIHPPLSDPDSHTSGALWSFERAVYQIKQVWATTAVQIRCDLLRSYFLL